DRYSGLRVDFVRYHCTVTGILAEPVFRPKNHPDINAKSEQAVNTKLISDDGSLIDHHPHQLSFQIRNITIDLIGAGYDGQIISTGQLSIARTLRRPAT